MRIYSRGGQGATAQHRHSGPSGQIGDTVFTEKRLIELGYGYDLDCGGYAFENAHSLPGVVADDSGELSDYFEHASYDLLLLNVGAYAFSEDDDGLPRLYRTADGSRYRRVFRGQLRGSDRSCNCSGCISDDHDAMPMSEDEIKQALNSGASIDLDREPSAPIKGWLFSGACDPDSAYPLCERCEGTGYVDSVGGSVGLYEADRPRAVEWREDRRPRF